MGVVWVNWVDTSGWGISPDALLVGLVVGPQVVHLALCDHTQVNVAAGAQVVEYTSCDGVTDQTLSIVLLKDALEERIKNGHCGLYSVQHSIQYFINPQL